MTKETLMAQLPPIRVTVNEKANIQSLADNENRTLSNYVRTVLINHVNSLKAGQGNDPTQHPYIDDHLKKPLLNTDRTTGVNEMTLVASETTGIQFEYTGEDTLNDPDMDNPTTPTNTELKFEESPKVQGTNPADGWSIGGVDSNEPSY